MGLVISLLINKYVLPYKSPNDSENTAPQAECGNCMELVEERKAAEPGLTFTYFVCAFFPVKAALCITYSLFSFNLSDIILNKGILIL